MLHIYRNTYRGQLGEQVVESTHPRVKGEPAIWLLQARSQVGLPLWATPAAEATIAAAGLLLGTLQMTISPAEKVARNLARHSLSWQQNYTLSVL